MLTQGQANISMEEGAEGPKQSQAAGVHTSFPAEMALQNGKERTAFLMYSLACLDPCRERKNKNMYIESALHSANKQINKFQVHRTVNWEGKTINSRIQHRNVSSRCQCRDTFLKLLKKPHHM